MWTYHSLSATCLRLPLFSKRHSETIARHTSKPLNGFSCKAKSSTIEGFPLMRGFYLVKKPMHPNLNCLSMRGFTLLWGSSVFLIPEYQMNCLCTDTSWFILHNINCRWSEISQIFLCRKNFSKILSPFMSTVEFSFDETVMTKAKTPLLLFSFLIKAK